MVPFKNCKFSLEETQFMAESSFISFWLPVFLFRYKVFWRNISQKKYRQMQDYRSVILFGVDSLPFTFLYDLSPT